MLRRLVCQVGPLRNGAKNLIDDAFLSELLGSDGADVDAGDEVVEVVVVRVVGEYLAEVLALDVLLHSVLHF